MGATVAELQRRMSSREFTEWAVYYELEPFGEERADLRAGIVASTVANTARDPKKRHKAFEPKEFMPQFGEQEAPDADELLEKVVLINAMFGGKDLRSGK